MRRLMNPLIPDFMRHAFTGIEQMTAAQRADHYEAAAILLKEHSAEEADAAMQTAIAIRKAEGLQLVFINLLNSEGRGA